MPPTAARSMPCWMLAASLSTRTVATASARVPLVIVLRRRMLSSVLPVSTKASTGPPDALPTRTSSLKPWAVLFVTLTPTGAPLMLMAWSESPTASPAPIGVNVVVIWLLSIATAPRSVVMPRISSPPRVFPSTVTPPAPEP